MKSSINNIFFVSVESRKGGVGKTTVSLALAQSLLSKGYIVLLLDLDLAGTKLSDSFIKEHDSYLHSVEYCGKQLNLVDVYKNVFLSGGVIPAIEKLNIDENKCNYISSDLYCRSEDTPIEDPRVMLDPLHSYWMRKMLTKLSESFSDFVKTKRGKGVIILDNGPGYSSLETTIHEMFTTIGPERAKFLLVSSVDDQDWNAVEQLTSMLVKMLNEKIEGGRYYQVLLNGGEYITIKSPYFDEIWKSLCETNGVEPEYYSEEHDVSNTTNFICRLVNKAPFEKKLIDVVRKMGEDVVFVPYIQNLQYYFCSLVSMDNMKLPFKNVSFSGNVKSILEDNQKFERCVESLAAYDLKFLKQDWAPLDIFRRLSDYYSMQEIPVKPVDSSLREAVDSELLDGVSSEDYAKTVVVEFLHSLCDNRNKKEETDAIVNEAVILLSQMGDSIPLNLQTKKESFRHLAEPVLLVGLAIYYLQNYSSICRLLSSVIASVQKPSIHRNLDLEKLSSMFDNAIVGQERMNKDFWDRLNEILTTQVNMRRMLESMDIILKRWGV